MSKPNINRLKNSSYQLSWKLPYLKILVLFGSQATEKNTNDSDWDFAVLYDKSFYKKQLEENAWNILEIPSVLGNIFHINHEKIDLIDLSRCHPFVADSIAIEGELIYEKVPGDFEKYRKKIILNKEDKKEISQQLRRNIASCLNSFNLTLNI